MTISVASVRPVSRTKFCIAPSAGYQVVIFRLPDGSAEAVVIDSDHTESTRLAIEKPADGQKLQIEKGPYGGFILTYIPIKEPERGPFICCENDADCNRPCFSHPWFDPEHAR